jgi:RHS repeat-associated protein
VLLLFIACLLLGAARTAAQNIQYTKNSTDAKLRSELTINPATLGLEFQLPIAGYPGRAGLNVPITISYSSKVWRIKYQGYNPGGFSSSGQPLGNGYTIVSAEYGEYSHAGWTSSIGVPVIDTWSSSENYDQFGNPAGSDCSNGCFYIDRALVRMPDGSAHELRSGDQPLAIGTTPPDNLYAVDGSRLRYQRSTGTLYMPDGSRVVGSTLVDRNGNVVTYGTGVTDTLGRGITPPPLADGPGNISYTPLGMTGTYTFRWRNLGDPGVLTTSQPLAYYASGACPPSAGSNTPRLFTPGNVNTCFGNGNNVFNPVVLHQVVLPTGQAYTFTYNINGEIDKVQLPTDGYERYEYAQVDGVSSSQQPYSQANRGVVRRYVSASGSGSDEVVWQYGKTGQVVSITAPDNTLVESYLHWDSPMGGTFGYSADGARAGRAYDERFYSAPDGGGVRHLLRRRLTDWAVTGSNATAQFPYAQQYANRNPRVAKEVELLLDTSGDALAKVTTYGYDLTYEFYTGAYETSVTEYDYVSVPQPTAQTAGVGSFLPPSQWLRRTEYDYLDAANAAYRDRNLLGLKKETRVKDSSGAVVARTVVGYDENGLADCPQIIRHDSGYGASFTTRGNATSVTSYAGAAGMTGSVTSTTHYDIAGNAVSMTDPNGNTSTVTYTDSFSDLNNFRNTYAYATSVTAAAPNPAAVSNPSGGASYPAGAFGSTVAFTAYTTYDFNTGMVTRTTDANGKTTTYNYTDPLNRLKVVTSPDGGTTTYDYGRYNNAGRVSDYVSTATSLDAGRSVISYQYFDGLGRSTRSFLYEGGSPAQYLTSDTQYDAMGRVWRVSNPHRTTGSDQPVDQQQPWTTTEYDVLGRVKKVTTPDGAAVTSAYNGLEVTVTDQAGRKRRSVSDGLGRLAQVTEDPTTGGLNYLTAYTYDVLGNLRTVTQGAQPARVFTYDSLSRLTSASNPESGTISYGYDAAGNLTSRTDARGVQTSYIYDRLNRHILTHYADSVLGPTNHTPDVERHYDGASNGKGRLWWSQKVGVVGTAFDAYDAAGRPTQYHQIYWVGTNWGQNFNVSLSYDKAGNVTSQTYPSGHTVSYGYDAAGRTESFTGRLGDGVQRTYADQVTYSEFGGIQQERFGTQTPLFHKLHYNRRGQLFDIRLSTVAWATDPVNWNRGAIVNYYSGNYAWEGDPTTPPATDNNGNLRRQQSWVPGDDSYNGYAYAQDTFEYDALNRLSWVSELHGGAWGQSGQDFKQVFDYDRWGNRTVNLSQSPQVPVMQYDFERGDLANTNRLYAPGDLAYTGPNYTQRKMQYDAAGNLVHDAHTGAGGRVYDAENRMTAAVDSTGNWDYYTYDADGRRVKRKIANEEWWQVYGMGGELVAEYKAGAATYLPSKEYGYRGGEMLVTMSSGDDGRLKRFVQNLYYGALHRDPTAQELQDKTNELAAAGAQSQAQLLQTAKNIARTLFTQTTYETSPYRTEAQYVADLYYTYLQRAPDDSGLSGWAGAAAGGATNRSNVCDGFQESAEFAVVVSTLYGTSGSDDERTDAFINKFYLAATGAFASPSDLQQKRAQLNAAAAQGPAAAQAAAEAMGRSLFASQVTDLSLPAQQFVTNLYEGFLQRGPDAGGLSWWTGEAGTTVQSRQHALDAFAVCDPFKELAGTLYRETFWLVDDQVGTPRMVADKSGSLAGVKRHDYLPFGEELFADMGGRTTAQGYSKVDNVRQKFTSYERDGETGLDFAQARMYASRMGRFTSTDPVLMSKDRILDPQGINLYAYCANNPLIHTDPDGKYFVGTNGKRVEVSLQKDRLVVGRNASADLKRIVSLTNVSQSKSAVSSLLAAANSATRVNYKISLEKGVYTDPLDPTKAGPLYGATRPHDKTGKSLDWSDKLNGFNGNPEYIKDNKGNMVYKEVTITVYEGSLTGAGLTRFGSGTSGAVNDPNVSTNEALVITTAHEETHVTDQAGVDNIRNRTPGFDPEVTPTNVHNQVDREIQQNRNRSRP